MEPRASFPPSPPMAPSAPPSTWAPPFGTSPAGGPVPEPRGSRRGGGRGQATRPRPSRARRRRRRHRDARRLRRRLARLVVAVERLDPRGRGRPGQRAAHRQGPRRRRGARQGRAVRGLDRDPDLEHRSGPLRWVGHGDRCRHGHRARHRRHDPHQRPRDRGRHLDLRDRAREQLATVRDPHRVGHRRRPRAHQGVGHLGSGRGAARLVRRPPGR